MQPQFTYQDALAASEKISWRVEDLIGGDKTLDFDKPFLPETLARVEPLAFLSATEQLTLNQIRGHGYLYMFGLVEEFILPFVMDHARERLNEDDYAVRAFLEFAGEEAKHIHLFKCFRREFEDGFGNHCEVIGPPEAIAEAVLSHSRLAVALTILHIEWMTQRHYLDSVHDDRDLDPQFKSLLRHHWMEEAQHAKLDTLMIGSIAEALPADDIARAVEEYVEIGKFLDGGVRRQAELDLEALTRTTGRRFTASERDRFLDVQHAAQRWTFIGSGMTHANFLATLESLSPAARAPIEQLARAFC
ncbi:MAG: hypothetical protein H6842_15175 [Rhodospirillaceae bacterium]|nr:hypothetical protein [Rhodospirillaceae bacterium]